MHDHGPAVVLTRLRGIQFVAAARTMLGFPQIAGRRIDGQALFAAVTVRPDFGQRAWLADEGIARCGRTIGRDANYFAEMVVDLLRHVPWGNLRAVADGDEQIA